MGGESAVTELRQDQADGCPFFTIGHSNRPLDEFLALLQQSEIACLVDVRKLTRSRANPQFNETSLSVVLAQAGVDYVHLAALGGLRGKRDEVPENLNAYWRNASFHRYADYALSPAFHAGLQHLLALGKTQRCAIMCAEAVWWRCHRRLVADNLLAHGRAVFHIMGLERIETATLTPAAIIREDRTVVYPGYSL
ncbi:DUF488 domain-containing protein [Methylobacillus sp.]|uniref:DUF488 domain-containing protein n=1 Tax=Methylobacillus sp. TaxID=56818 RepID=UPI002FE1B3E0